MISQLVRWGYSHSDLMEMEGAELKFWYGVALKINKEESKQQDQ